MQSVTINGPNKLLQEAAIIGSIELCRLAILSGATDVDNMLLYAAKGGHEDICRLAKE